MRTSLTDHALPACPTERPTTQGQGQALQPATTTTGTYHSALCLLINAA